MYAGGEECEMARMKAKKKRNPQDTTLRNLRATRRDVANLRVFMQSVVERVKKLEKRVYEGL